MIVIIVFPIASLFLSLEVLSFIGFSFNTKCRIEDGDIVDDLGFRLFQSENEGSHNFLFTNKSSAIIDYSLSLLAISNSGLEILIFH